MATDEGDLTGVLNMAKEVSQKYGIVMSSEERERYEKICVLCEIVREIRNREPLGYSST